MGELESQVVESSYCRHLHGHRPRVPTEPAHAWWGTWRREGGTISRWWPFVLPSRIRKNGAKNGNKKASSLLDSLARSSRHPSLRFASPRSRTTSGPSFHRVGVCVSLLLPSGTRTLLLRSTRRPALPQNGSSTTFLLFLPVGQRGGRGPPHPRCALCR